MFIKALNSSASRRYKNHGLLYSNPCKNVILDLAVVSNLALEIQMRCIVASGFFGREGKVVSIYRGSSHTSVLYTVVVSWPTQGANLYIWPLANLRVNNVMF